MWKTSPESNGLRAGLVSINLSGDWLGESKVGLSRPFRDCRGESRVRPLKRVLGAEKAVAKRCIADLSDLWGASGVGVRITRSLKRLVG